ncbi:acyl carrier protein [Nonomuraea sp. NPDC055795]|uniref:Acyl carrier protein n=1 Tax=Nonomuraea endophytica TaxID=714136 RepID=A0A7W7ZZ39_9ACTN|nr:acyl carrier protein [Nonomuraea endophytica]MBB5076502.1 acyl carrier protein [Nonomuraea endophytica]
MTETREDIYGEVSAIIQEVTGMQAADVSPKKSIVDDLDIDSLSMVEIGVAVEDKFAVEITDAEMPKIVTVEDLIDHIEQAMAARD